MERHSGGGNSLAHTTGRFQKSTEAAPKEGGPETEGEASEGEDVNVDLSGCEALPEPKAHKDERVNANGVGTHGAATADRMSRPGHSGGGHDVKDVEQILKPVVDERRISV